MAAHNCKITTRIDDFDVLSKNLQNLRFTSDVKGVNGFQRNSANRIGGAETNVLGANENMSLVVMQLDILERKIKRLVNKLKKFNIHLEVFDAEDIEYGATIGKGGEGLVQCCTVKYNGLQIPAAVKTVLNNSDDSLSLTFDEIELLCLARDPILMTTIHVYGVAAVPDEKNPGMGHLVIITEAGLMNSLQLYQNEDIPLHITYDIWSCLSSALHCIHNKKIIHQDLKPENILVTRVLRDTEGRLDKVEVKVIDFGMARLVENDCVYTDDILGTEGYHAPEVLFNDHYDFRADIFVLGVTFCIMLLPRSSLKKSTLLASLKRIDEAKHQKLVGSSLFDRIISPLVDNEESISEDIRNMICLMLESVERRKITLLEIAHICQKEALSKRKQFCVSLPSANSGRVYHQDSGIDSFEIAIISDVTKRNTRSNARRGANAAVAHVAPTHAAGDNLRTPLKAGEKCRRRVRVESVDSSGSEPTGSGRPPELSMTTPMRDEQNEPVCRRTRSAKRLHESAADKSNDDDDEDAVANDGAVRKPPAKRILRGKS